MYNKVKNAHKYTGRTILFSEIVKQVSDASWGEDGLGGYEDYEVRDVLHLLAYIVQHNLRQDNAIKLDGIGWLTLRKQRPRVWKTALFGKEVHSKANCSLSIRADKAMKRVLAGTKVIFPEDLTVDQPEGNLSEDFWDDLDEETTESDLMALSKRKLPKPE